jgi:hypothetical protein
MHRTCWKGRLWCLCSSRLRQHLTQLLAASPAASDLLWQPAAHKTHSKQQAEVQLAYYGEGAAANRCYKQKGCWLAEVLKA